MDFLNNCAQISISSGAIYLHSYDNFKRLIYEELLSHVLWSKLLGLPEEINFKAILFFHFLCLASSTSYIEVILKEVGKVKAIHSLCFPVNFRTSIKRLVNWNCQWTHEGGSLLQSSWSSSSDRWQVSFIRKCRPGWGLCRIGEC